MQTQRPSPMDISQLALKAPKKEIKTHALRKATSMPIRQSYEIDKPVVPTFRPRPPVPVFRDSPTRSKRSATLQSGHAPVVYRPSTPLPAARDDNHNAFGTTDHIISGDEDAEVLFSHSSCKIVSFTVTLTIGNSQELMPFKSAADRTIAVGPLTLYRLKPQNIAFIQSGKVIHPVMAKSACWCVEEHVGKGVWGRGRGRGVFILRIRSDVFWRVEMNEAGIYGSVEEFKTALRSILAFEMEVCPFARAEVVIVGGDEERRVGRGRARPKGRQDTRERRHSKVNSTRQPSLEKTDDFQERTRAYSLGPSRQFPLHHPLLLPNATPTLESFDDILGRSFTRETTFSPPSSPYSKLNNSQFQQAALESGKKTQPSHSSPIGIPHSTNSSSDSFSSSVSSSLATYSTNTSFASSPPMGLCIQKSSSSAPRPRATSSTYPHPWTISPQTCTTVTTAANTQTIFASSARHDAESLRHLGTATPQPSQMFMSAADMVIGKPSKYLIGAMMSIAKSVVGNKEDGATEAHGPNKE